MVGEKEVKHGDFDGVATGNVLELVVVNVKSSIRVKNDDRLKQRVEFLVDLGVLSLVHVVTSGELDNFHVGGGQHTSLAGNHIVQSAASFERVQVFDQKVLILEAVSGESHGN